jgi:hypothetical protein
MMGAKMTPEIAALCEVSVRGRVAFSICCLETAILHFVAESESWRFLLDELWKYTTESRLDRWQEIIAEYTPSVILDQEHFSDGDFEFIDEQLFNRLHRLYSQHESVLSELVDLVFDVGTIELFGSIDGFGQESLNQACRVMEKVQAIGLRLPELDRFATYSRLERRGWGNPFDPGSLRKV